MFGKNSNSSSCPFPNSIYKAIKTIGVLIINYSELNPLHKYIYFHSSNNFLRGDLDFILAIYLQIIDFFFGHNLKEHVLKFKKNPTLGQKSEK